MKVDKNNTYFIVWVQLTSDSPTEFQQVITAVNMTLQTVISWQGILYQVIQVTIDYCI